ncbi:MAG: hypothetical protein DHS20C14_01260 [Phycisphaeraceae bacterium]|nr:MAG: hypothetical protein DHS20C14_01260 [Phycisphaeraceae bacterium]
MRAYFMIIAAVASGPQALGAGSPGYVEDGVVQLYEQLGENPGEQFGYVTETLADFTGDGVPECLNSAPYRRLDGQLEVGVAFVHDGATGEILATHTGGIPLGFFGWRLARLGDVNADGTPDYAVGAAGDIYRTSNPTVPGRVFVYSGADHALLHELVAATYATTETDLGTDRFGQDIAPLDDINGDGHDDFLVTADLWDEDANNAGRAWVISGADLTVLRTHPGPAANDRYGSSANLLGDVTGDGIGEYFICARNHMTTGMGWVYDGATGNTLFAFTGDSSGMANFGQYFASTPGDCTGDGVPDIFVGDHEDRTFGGRTGAAYVFDVAHGLANPGAVLAPYWSVKGVRQRQWVGFGGGVGDVDHDGCADVATDFLYLPDKPEHVWSGRVRVYSGRTGRVLRTITSTRGNAAGTTGEQFGYSISPLADANGDGEVDYVISAGFRDDEQGQLVGAYYGIAGRAPCPGDYDGDHDTDTDDVDIYVHAFLGGSRIADLDANGVRNIDDIDAFVASFLAGCT